MSSPLHKMFSKVPDRYDLINHLATLGLDVGWRKRAVAMCLRGEPGAVLDLCTGTGDLIAMLAGAASPEVRLVAGDFVSPMLEEARAKLRRKGRADRVELARMDAAALPFANGALDAVTISFGFRNLTYKNPGRDRHLAELRRVLRPGGRLVVVESSRPPNKAMGAMSRLFMRGFVAPVGGLVSGQRAAYRYLVSSMLDFYTAEEVCELLRGAGFASVEFDRLFGGVAAVHVATA